MNNEQLAKTIEATWTHLYKDRYYSDPIAQAQDQLMGRTHYVDPETLRYHHARVLRARPVCSGLLFRIIESTAADRQITEDRVRRYARGSAVRGQLVPGAIILRCFMVDRCQTARAFRPGALGLKLTARIYRLLAERVKRTQEEARPAADCT
jgi:hypothetical protein